jgi:hypothetical protein
MYSNDSSPIITNSILWDNATDEIDRTISDVEETCSDIMDRWEGEGNNDKYPMFVDPGNDDFHLQINSPCINAGNPDYIPEPGRIDIDGQHRVMRNRNDIGVDEVPFPHYKVPEQWR